MRPRVIHNKQVRKPKVLPAGAQACKEPACLLPIHGIRQGFAAAGNDEITGEDVEARELFFEGGQRIRPVDRKGIEFQSGVSLFQGRVVFEEWFAIAAPCCLHRKNTGTVGGSGGLCQRGCALTPKSCNTQAAIRCE